MKIESFYTAFGFVTCAFARMEANLRALIAGLAFGDNSVTASVFLDSTQLTENTRTLRELARDHHDHEAAMVMIAKRIEQLRTKRNLFIHGLWEEGDFLEQGGHAIVRDLNSVYEKKANSRQWIRGKACRYSIKDFNELIAEIEAIQNAINNLCEELERTEDLIFSHFGSTTAHSIRCPVPEYLTTPPLRADQKNASSPK